MNLKEMIQNDINEMACSVELEELQSCFSAYLISLNDYLKQVSCIEFDYYNGALSSFKYLRLMDYFLITYTSDSDTMKKFHFRSPDGLVITFSFEPKRNKLSLRYFNWGRSDPRQKIKELIKIMKNKMEELL